MYHDVYTFHEEDIPFKKKLFYKPNGMYIKF